MKYRVFIGSGNASLLERKTLIYSIRKHTKADVDVYVFNGTHNSIEKNNEAPVSAPLSLKAKYHNITEFSLYRFLIPQLCGQEGLGVWLDSDMICLCDIRELFEVPLNGKQFIARAEAYNDSAYASKGSWGLSVMLIDCAKTKFSLDEYIQEMETGLYSYADLLGMREAFLSKHPFDIGPLESKWNEFDYFDSSTKLIHYTDLYTQPWKYKNHPYGDLWYQYFDEARKEGFITEEDIYRTMVQSYVRRDLLKGNFSFLGREVALLKKVRRQIKRQLSSQI
ncbi:MAG: glycosyl transferase [Bacteriovoracia bacterium]